MVGILLNFLLAVIVLFIFYKIAELALGMFGGLPPQALQILKLICLLILVIWMFDIIGYAHVGFPVIRWGTP